MTTPYVSGCPACEKAAPILTTLIAAGTVWIEDSAIVGRASDGIAVQIGTVDTMEATERYLADHPNPSDW